MSRPKNNVGATETRLAKAFDNPVRAFLRASRWLEGSCYCGNEGAQNGLALVAAMAAAIKAEDEWPEVPLTVSECADVLVFITCRVEFETIYGGDPGHGLFLIISQVEQELRAKAPEVVSQEIARRAAALGYFAFADEESGWGITLEKLGDPEGDGLLGGSAEEALAWIAAKEQRA